MLHYVQQYEYSKYYCCTASSAVQNVRAAGRWLGSILSFWFACGPVSTVCPICFRPFEIRIARQADDSRDQGCGNT